MISISTAWNYHPKMNPHDLLSRVREAGLDTIELGYKITAEDLPPLVAAIKSSGMKVSSVHNFCPVPNDHPSPRHPSNYYRLSALDDAERKLAVQWTREAVNTAVAVGAKVVVIHAGTVEMPEELAEGMFKKHKESGQGPEVFAELRDQFVKQRAALRGPYVEQVIRSLYDILPHAAARNIKIGLESRYYPTEIPNHIEIGELLDLYHKKGLWYWHDVGHSEINERLGIYPHIETLKKYLPQLVGFHLHGVVKLKDHHAPLDGDLDLKPIFALMKKEHIKVIESHGNASLEQIKKAVELLNHLES